MGICKNNIMEKLQEDIINSLKDIIENKRPLGKKEINHVVHECFMIFKNFSKYLMNKHCLYVNGSLFEFIEIEYYMFNCDVHNDPYVHMSSKQLCSCEKLYLHEKGRGGIDLTFGNPEIGLYGGILLKSLKLKDTEGNDGFIIGQTFVKDRISRLIFPNKSTVSNFELAKEIEHLENKGDIKISSIHEMEKDIFFSSRVGLKNENITDERIRIFAIAPYRFVREDIYCESDSYKILSENKKQNIKKKEELKYLKCILEKDEKYIDLITYKKIADKFRDIILCHEN